jgi:ionotropic glutamate receptor
MFVISLPLPKLNSFQFDILIKRKKDSNATGVFTKLRKNVDSFPNSRCYLISQCLSLITPGSRNTFAEVVFFFNVKLQARSYQLGIIKDNFDKTGKCGLQLAGDCFLSLPVTFALQKRSPYTETINRGYIIKKNKIVSRH